MTTKELLDDFILETIPEQKEFKKKVFLDACKAKGLEIAIDEKRNRLIKTVLGIQFSQPLDPSIKEKTMFSCSLPTEEKDKIFEALKSSKNKPSVELVGANGNVFNLLAICKAAARKDKWSKDQTDVFLERATSGDYDNALCVMMECFNVAGPDGDNRFKDARDLTDDEERDNEIDEDLEDE